MLFSSKSATFFWLASLMLCYEIYKINDFSLTKSGLEDLFIIIFFFSDTRGRNECVTNEPQRTSAGRLTNNYNTLHLQFITINSNYREKSEIERKRKTKSPEIIAPARISPRRRNPEEALHGSRSRTNVFG